MTVKQTIPPAGLPLTLSEVKEHLGISHDSADSLLQSLIASVTDYVERRTGRQLLTASFTLFLDAFPPGQTIIEVPKPPLQEVTEIRYFADGAQIELLEAEWRTHTSTMFGEIEPVNEWPVADVRRNAVEIDFVAGYADADAIPPALKQCLLGLTAHWWMQREPLPSADEPRPVWDRFVPHHVSEILNGFMTDWL